MKFLITSVRNLVNIWNQFWFKPSDAFPLSCFRSFVCFCLFVFYSIRFFDIRIFFYETGLMTAPFAKILHVMESRYVLNFILSSDGLLYACYLVFLLALLLLALGIGGRVLALVAFILHLVFLQRNPSIVYITDTVATFWLFYLVLASGKQEMRWVDFFISSRKRGLVSDRRPAGSWWNTVSMRLIQVQLCVFYFFSGLRKLEGSRSWQDGTALVDVSFFYDMAIVDPTFWLHIPIISGLLTCFIIAFEWYFPVLIWHGKLRGVVMVLGVLFHLLLAFGLGLYFLSLLMLCAYVVFIPPAILRQFFIRFQKK